MSARGKMLTETPLASALLNAIGVAAATDENPVLSALEALARDAETFRLSLETYGEEIDTFTVEDAVGRIVERLRAIAQLHRALGDDVRTCEVAS